jgi:hypothetical protein
MGEVYRQEIAALAEALNDEAHGGEAAALVRKLIDRIVLTPVEHEGRKTFSVDLYGHLAGILSVATKARKPVGASGFDAESVKLVAGARKHLYRTVIMAWVAPCQRVGARRDLQAEQVSTPRCAYHDTLRSIAARLLQIFAPGSLSPADQASGPACSATGETGHAA